MKREPLRNEGGFSRRNQREGILILITQEKGNIVRSKKPFCFIASLFATTIASAQKARAIIVSMKPDQPNMTFVGCDYAHQQ